MDASTDNKRLSTQKHVDLLDADISVKSKDGVVCWGNGVTEVMAFETEFPTIVWLGLEQHDDGRLFAVFNVRDYDSVALLAIECNAARPDVRLDWFRGGSPVVYVAEEESGGAR